MRELSYNAPRTVAEAVALLRGPGYRIFAGGTDLLIQLRAGMHDVQHLVDVKRIDELNELEVDRRSGLRMGAAVPCAVLTEHPVARLLYPGLIEATALIGSTQIQSRATVAGNLCNASPAADTPPALVALDATCTIAGPSGRREVGVRELTTAPGRTILQPGELVVDIRVPPPHPGSADAYQRLIPRSEMDIAVVGVAACVTLENGRCKTARIALGAVGPTVILAERAMASLRGKVLDEEAIAAAAELARAEARPISDLRAPAEYREEIVAVLTRRVLADAVERARQRCAADGGA